MSSPSLYHPAPYAARDPLSIVRNHPFATVIGPDLQATAAPVVFERKDEASPLIGHLASRNPHAQAMTDGAPVLAVFAGPHAYISPRWYLETPEVPTWDYIAAHVRGRLEMTPDAEDKLAVLRRTAECVEAGFDNPWTLDDAPEGRVAFLLPMITAFRIHVDRIDAVEKLSQRQPAGDRRRIAAGLRAIPQKTVSDYIEELEPR